jgi:DnaJ-class molecular chaperone
MELQFIRRTTQQTTCIACHGEGKIYGHVCYICQGKGTRPIQVEADITGKLHQLKQYIKKEDFTELFTNKP